LLLDYEWPGNIRQLRNAMERLSVMTAGGLINVEEVSRALQIQDFTDTSSIPHLADPSGRSAQPWALDHADEVPASEDNSPLFAEEKAAYEREIIFKALQECHGSKSRAAKKLGISRTTLWRKLQQHADG
jgi:DNA-binding NtrC family response regulator